MPVQRVYDLVDESLRYTTSHVLSTPVVQHTHALVTIRFPARNGGANAYCARLIWWAPP
jgi:hypothetical protein